MNSLFTGIRRSHPERMAVTQPRVARNELPWVMVKETINSERVEAADNSFSVNCP
jgi:hypothetical protein